ncbi:MAG TPA: hypothetical protein VKX25_19305 [Bryobacteraceae bacterium]|nr:hypothetical protein [Bryobacteraceae bacterium]
MSEQGPPLQPGYPTICHVDLGNSDCPGCLAVREEGGTAELVCNECGQVFAKVAPSKIEEAIAALGKAAQS